MLGQGGFGAVYAATDEQTQREVALKVLLTDDRISVARFMQEARVAASLATEHVVAVHELGTTEHGVTYIAMERLHGRDLGAEIADRWQLPVDEAVGLVLQAMLGLAHAHARGIVHRDLKPRNLFVTDARIVKVLDFGVAKTAEAITNAGDILGTALYMAPEQLRDSRNVDARCDIWSIGVVIYELVTGRPIYDAANNAELGVKILTERPVPLRARDPNLPAELEAVLDRCFAREPAERYADLAALADALRPWGSAEIVERIRTVLQPPRKPWKLAVVAIVLGVALGFGIGALIWLTR
jgi:serine/threonine-protein kinase